MDIAADYISIARELIDLQQRLQADLPYHINLVDAIGADENANSRILAGILSYHDKAGNYKMLKAFAKHFFNDTNLAEMIEKPVIVTEQLVRNDKRIDIYIHEPGKYAIILENKVMDAPEQPHQLANYIEGLNDFGFANEQIFIGYLPRTTETQLSDKSWTNRHGTSYRNEFQPRFSNISFRDGILPWLKNMTSHGLRSVYHEQTREAFGKETTPTYYHNFNADLPFFLDYAYTDIPVKSFGLFPWDKDMSNHVGMELEI